jgi:cytochrome c oxidase subunit 2
MGNTQHAYDHVQGIYLPIAVGVFVVVVGTLLVLLIGGARRKLPGGRSEALAVEIVYAGALGLVVAFLLWVTFTAETPIDRTAAHLALRVRVIAAQWSWRFVYPDGVSVAAVDTWHPTPAYVPTDTQVEFVGTSEDVIHGFWVPTLHYQRQLVPGYTTRFDLLFGAAGYYGGACSVLCGVDHSEMHFALRAVSPQSFHAWLTSEAARQGVSS